MRKQLDGFILLEIFKKKNLMSMLFPKLEVKLFQYASSLLEI